MLRGDPDDSPTRAVRAPGHHASVDAIPDPDRRCDCRKTANGIICSERCAALVALKLIGPWRRHSGRASGAGTTTSEEASVDTERSRATSSPAGPTGSYKLANHDVSHSRGGLPVEVLVPLDLETSLRVEACLCALVFLVDTSVPTPGAPQSAAVASTFCASMPQRSGRQITGCIQLGQSVPVATATKAWRTDTRAAAQGR